MKKVRIQTILIIVLSHHQHGYHRPSLTSPPYRSSLLAGHRGYALYIHGAAECRFKQTIQFSICTLFECKKIVQFSSFWPLDRTLTDATSPGKTAPVNDSNSGLLRIPQSSCMSETSLSECSVTYLWHSLWEGLTPLQRSSRFISSITIYCLHTVQWLQVLQFIVCTQFNGFKYNYLLFAHSSMTSIIAIYRMHAVQWLQVLLSNSNRFICT